MDGVANIAADFRHDEMPAEHQARALDAMAASVRDLAGAVSALFSAHKANIQRLQHVALASDGTRK